MALIEGDASSNTLRGTRRDDRIFGRGDDDRLFGRRGNDRLNGGGDDDVLKAGRGNDVLKGGDDDDVLNGGIGNDRMTGGDDGDRFVFLFGRDVITDFDADEPAGEDGDDVLDLRGLADLAGFDTFAQVRAAASQDGDDLVLTFLVRNFPREVVLLDLQLSELGRADVLL